MVDRLLEGVFGLVAWLRIVRPSGPLLLLGGFGLGAVFVGFAVPSVLRLIRMLRDFSAWCAWQADERVRQAEEREVRAETDSLLAMLGECNARSAQPTTPTAAEEDDAPVRAVEAVVVDDDDEDKTRLWQFEREQPAAGASVSGRLVAIPWGSSRPPKRADLRAARALLERRRGVS